MQNYRIVFSISDDNDDDDWLIDDDDGDNENTLNIDDYYNDYKGDDDY